MDARGGVSPTPGEQARLRYLSPTARDVLRTASVIGTSFSVIGLESLAERTAVQLAGPLREALAAGLLATQGRLLTFRSERLREALYREIPLALRAAMHRDLSRYAWMHMMLANGLFLAGNWDSAAVEAETAAGLADGGRALAVQRTGILALIAVHRDDLAVAHTLLAAARQPLASPATAARSSRLALASALVAEASGHSGSALETLTSGWQRFAPNGTGATVCELGPELIRRLVGAGQKTSAADIAATVVNRAERHPDIPGITGAALTCKGLTERDPKVLLDAVAAYRDIDQPLSLGLACEDAAALHAAAGSVPTACELLTEAQEHFGRLKAVRCVARTAASLRALGVRRGVRAPRARATSGWESLTGTERKVVALVADRLTNPEIAGRMFLSRRTIETHVSHALAKLGLRSRTELAAAAATHVELPKPRDGAPTSLSP